MCRNKRNTLGLLVLLAFSVAMAGGRKPETEKINTTMRRITANEIMEMLQKFPEIVPDDFPNSIKEKVFNKKDTSFIKRLFRFSEVENPLLRHLFPAARFYKGLKLEYKPPPPYLMAIVGDKRYKMPLRFNHLLLEHNIEVTDKNIIELAKVFIILALGKERVLNPLKATSEEELLSFPQITFLEGKRIKEWDSYWGMIVSAKIKCVVNGETQVWEFLARRGQFLEVVVFINDKPYRSYPIIFIEKSKGLLDQVPRIEIATDIGNATVEQDSFYYLITYRNGAPTNYWVRFRLYGFEPNEPYVYIKIEPIRRYTYGPNDILGPVIIGDDGSGYYDWTPGPEIQTGISEVVAGIMAPGATFEERARVHKWLTLEKVITEKFPGFGVEDSFYIYYTNQFFVNHPQGSGHAPIFANYVKNSAIESWQKQIIRFYRLLDEISQI